MHTQTTDHRREVEVLAYRAASFPRASASIALAEIAPHLAPADRDAAFGDLIDGLRVRDAATRACAVAPHEVADILIACDARTVMRAAGTLAAQVLADARTIAALHARDYDAVEGVDESLDGAVAELANVKAGYATAGEYGPDVDMDTVEDLVAEKVTEARRRLVFTLQARLDRTLVDFTVAAWRFADTARVRLEGGAR